MNTALQCGYCKKTICHFNAFPGKSRRSKDSYYSPYVRLVMDSDEITLET